MLKICFVTMVAALLATASTCAQILEKFNENDWKQLYTVDSIPILLFFRLDCLRKYQGKIADRNERFEAGCTIINKNLPTRQLRYLARKGNSWFMTYKHGGFSLHYHFVFYEVENGKVKTLICGAAGHYLETMEDINDALLKAEIYFRESAVED